MEIEAKIDIMRKNPIYLKVKRSLNSLQERRFRSGIVSIPSLENPAEILEMRYNSAEMKKVIDSYREKKTEFDRQMDELYVKKTRLENQLFKSPA